LRYVLPPASQVNQGRMMAWSRADRFLGGSREQQAPSLASLWRLAGDVSPSQGVEVSRRQQLPARRWIGMIPGHRRAATQPQPPRWRGPQATLLGGLFSFSKNFRVTLPPEARHPEFKWTPMGIPGTDPQAAQGLTAG
jgi:hypothetical protein